MKEKYKGEWSAIEVSNYENHKPVEGTLLLHDTDRQRLWDKVEAEKGKRVYVTYARPLIDESYAVPPIGSLTLSDVEIAIPYTAWSSRAKKI